MPQELDTARWPHSLFRREEGVFTRVTFATLLSLLSVPNKMKLLHSALILTADYYALRTEAKEQSCEFCQLYGKD